MNTLNNLNKLGAFEFETVTFKDLEKDKPYKIGIFRSLDTVYGRRILVELLELEKYIFLPERFKSMTESEIEVANTKNLLMIFKGLKQLENNRMANEIEFKEN